MGSEFKPVEMAKKIEEDYKSYILSTFKTDNSAYNEQIRKLVESEYQFTKGPYLQLSDNYLRDKSISNLTGTLLSNEFIELSNNNFDIKRPLYRHQIEAITNIIEKDRSTIVSTGTGSGKTESFLVPILNHLMKQVETGEINTPGVRAMIIYPMNALVNDQIKRLRDVLSTYPKITFGFFTGENREIESEEDYEDRFHVKPGINEVYLIKDMRKTPPNILITNYAMLEHILIRPENSVEIFNPKSNHLWKYIVLDEAHSYGGAKGAEVSMLLRRVRQTLGSDSLRFILTSATLGSGPKANEEAAEFANNLTGSKEFTKDDVIRSTIATIHEPEDKREIDIRFYRDMVKSGLNEESIRSLSNINPNVLICLGDIVIHDSRFWTIRKQLSEGIKTVSELSSECEIPEDDIVDFIEIASKSRDSEGQKLFDARYHTFIRSMDGVYITLKPSYKVLFAPAKKYFDEELDEEFAVFQMSVCYNCNALYLPVTEDDGHHLKQIVSDMIDEESQNQKQMLYLFAEGTEVGEDTEHYGYVCSKCGMFTPYGNNWYCDCGEKYQNLIKEVVSDIESNNLCKCHKCGQVNNKFGIVRDFYLGPEAASSVIASSLFNKMPDPKPTDRNPNPVKQFLLFSDSRKSASYAAVNLSESYENILVHRAIFELTNNYHSRFENGVPFDYLINMLSNKLMEIYDVDSDSKDIKDKFRKMAIIGILKEILGSGSNKSLQYSGLLKFEFETDMSLADVSKEKIKQISNTIATYLLQKGVIDTNATPELELKELDEISKGSRKFVKTNNDQDCKKRYPETVLLTKRVRDYLNKVTGENAQGFADEFVKQKFIKRDKKSYTIDVSRIYAYTVNSIYYCPKCLKHTPFSVDDICIGCGGTLECRKSDFLTSNEHYVKQYREQPLVPLTVKEHTAQISKKVLSDYQNRFIRQEINALSCSTTFEMGIDIGSLSTVFMRNVPPSPSNYIQRAGRAGRSDESSAFILTFCKTSSHDSHYFANPASMITGIVKTPIVNPNNPKIAIRHIFASSLAFYWKSLGQSPKDAEGMTDKNHIEGLKNYLSNVPENLKQYLEAIVPEEIQNYSSDDVTIDLKNDGWVNTLFGDNGRLDILLDEYGQDIDSLSDAEKRSSDKKEYRIADKIKRTISTVKKEDCLSFLSHGNIIPRYGFPVDTVNLASAKQYEENDFEMQRDLTMAIVEYAPGCQVVVNGCLITSTHLKTVKGRQWDVYTWYKCTECNNVALKRFISENDEDTRIECSHCGTPTAEKKGRMVVPKFGFLFTKNEKATINKPRKSRGKEFHYKGKESHNPEPFKIGSLSGYIEHNTDDELIAMTRDKYWVCDNCGYGIKSSNPPKTHKNSYGGDCTTHPHLYKLGNVFRTDVSIIHFDDPHNANAKEDDFISVLYALIEGLCSSINIDRNEIMGCLRKNADSSYDYVLFDNTPGGSGYVKSIKQDTLRPMIESSVEILEGCDCGGPDGDACCYGCLCNYNNQQYHGVMKRGVALRYLKSIIKRMDEL